MDEDWGVASLLGLGTHLPMLLPLSARPGWFYLALCELG